jgi:hypothetical protein
MAIGLLLEVGPEMDPEILGLVVLHLLGKEAGFLTMICGGSGLIIQMMSTGGGTNLIGLCQWTGVIKTVEGMAFSMKGKGLRGGHPLHLYLHLHFLNVADGDVTGEIGADLQLGEPHHQKSFDRICTWSGGEMIGILLGETE